MRLPALEWNISAPDEVLSDQFLRIVTALRRKHRISVGSWVNHRIGSWSWPEVLDMRKAGERLNDSLRKTHRRAKKQAESSHRLVMSWVERERTSS